MIDRLVLPPWLRLGLLLPLLVLNLWVLRQLLLPLAPFPALFLAAALIAFLLDLPTRWLHGRGLPGAWPCCWWWAWVWACWCSRPSGWCPGWWNSWWA
jgi:hypothetical protein